MIIFTDKCMFLFIEFGIISHIGFHFLNNVHFLTRSAADPAYSQNVQIQNKCKVTKVCRSNLCLFYLCLATTTRSNALLKVQGIGNRKKSYFQPSETLTLKWERFIQKPKIILMNYFNYNS